MKPILYASNATQFNSNGLGRLDAISCKITEERNGAFELEMEIAETALHASDIEMSSIIVSKVPDKSNLQAFRVYKTTKPINGKFKVFAQHISYQLSYVPVFPFEVLASSGACAETFVKLKANTAEDCPFTFTTDVTTVASFKINSPLSLRSALGGVEGSVLDKFGGEYSWDNYNVSFNRNRGVTTPNVSLRYGKNITDLTQEKYISNTYTGICPFWIDSEGNNLVTLPEKVIHSQYAANFPFQRTLVIDMSSDFQEQPTESALRAAATAYLNTTGVGIPTVSIKLSFVSLADTEEYKHVAALQSVKLCDIVAVQFEKLGIETTAKVVKYTYDVLKERYDSIEIGSVKTSLASTITNTNDAISSLQSKMTTKFGQLGNQLREDIDNATAWLTSGDGFVVAVKAADGSWKELLFMDTPDVTTAHNVLRVNQNGIGFSSTGVAGPYTQAWTLDGRMVIGGTNVPSLTVYDNQQHILFRIDHSGMVWNAANSSMSATGVLTATGATIRSSSSGSRITLDSSSSLKGYYDDDLHNIINMSNRSGINNNLIIDADHALHIRTPSIYVANESYGTGGGTVYETYNDYSGHGGGYDFVSKVKKHMEGCTELFLKGVSESEADVLATLPVLLDVEYTTFDIRHGMLMSGATTRSEEI